MADNQHTEEGYVDPWQRSGEWSSAGWTPAGDEPQHDGSESDAEWRERVAEEIRTQLNGSW